MLRQDSLGSTEGSDTRCEPEDKENLRSNELKGSSLDSAFTAATHRIIKVRFADEDVGGNLTEEYPVESYKQVSFF